MSFIKSIGSWFKQKKVEIDKALLVTFPGLARWMKANYSAYVQEGYTQNVYVYRAVAIQAQSCAGIDWLLFQRKADGDHSEVKRHPLIDLIKQPNPQQDKFEFVEALISHLLLSGRAFVYAPKIGERGNKRPKEIYLLRPDKVEPKLADDNRTVQKYLYNDTDSYDPEEVLFLKLFHPLSETEGLSPMSPAARSVDQNNESRKWNVSLLQNAAQPSGVYQTEQTLKDDQFARLQEQMPDRYAGSRNAGRPMLLEGGLQWQPTAFSPHDMSWLEGVRQSAREVGLAFGIAPELLGDPTVKTYASYKEARAALYTETVLPMLDRILGKINGWLCPMFGENLYFEANDDDIEALQENRNELYARLERASFLKLNEKRSEAGFEEVEGGDVILVPSNLYPTVNQDAD